MSVALNTLDNMSVRLDDVVNDTIIHGQKGRRQLKRSSDPVGTAHIASFLITENPVYETDHKAQQRCSRCQDVTPNSIVWDPCPRMDGRKLTSPMR